MESEPNVQIPETFISDEEKARKMADAEKPDRDRAINAKKTKLPVADRELYKTKAVEKGEFEGEEYDREMFGLKGRVDQEIRVAMNEGSVIVYTGRNSEISEGEILLKKHLKELENRIDGNPDFSLSRPDPRTGEIVLKYWG